MGWCCNCRKLKSKSSAMSHRIIIVGAGQAGVQVAVAAHNAGYREPITLIGDEPDLPYQRPPLSKGFLLDKPGQDRVTLRSGDFYADRGIELRLGEQVCELDRQARTVTTDRGETIPYTGLALATGTRVRRLPVAGENADGVCYLRSVADAWALKEKMHSASRAVVIGGGFIGLEVASALRSKQLPVTLIEAQDRLMPRVVAPPIADFYAQQHQRQGVTLMLATTVEEIITEHGRVCAVRCGNGESIEADLVVIGIGVVPNSELAAQAGLKCSDGIEVDQSTRTSDPAIVAAGDCALHPCSYAGGLIRLESVQNATEQSRVAGAVLAGREAIYDAVPWFWSEQYNLRLQMAGFSAGYDRYVIRGDPKLEEFSVFYFKSGKFLGIDSVNRPMDHIAGRKLLHAGIHLNETQAGDANLNLKSLLPGKSG